MSLFKSKYYAMQLIAVLISLSNLTWTDAFLSSHFLINIGLDLSGTLWHLKLTSVDALCSFLYLYGSLTYTIFWTSGAMSSYSKPADF